MTRRALCESASFPSSRCWRAVTRIRARNPYLEASWRERDDAWRAAGIDADSRSACLETHPSRVRWGIADTTLVDVVAELATAADERSVARTFAQQPRRKLVRPSTLSPQELEIQRGIVPASRLSPIQVTSSQRVRALSSVVEVG